MNATDFSPCHHIPVSADRHAADPKEDRESDTEIRKNLRRKNLRQSGGNLPSLALRSVAGLQKAVGMINLRSGEVVGKCKISARLNWIHKVNVELGKAFEDNHYDHLSPVIRHEFEALQRLGVIVHQLTEIASNFE